MPKGRLDLRPTWEQRASIGLTTPTEAEKQYAWPQLTIPQARIAPHDGGYVPFPLIARAHQHPARVKLVVGGIRGSKSLSGACEALSWTPHADLVWLAADSYDLCRQEFEYLAEGLISLEWTQASLISLPHSKYMPCSLETVWGTLVETRSLHDVSTFVARAPDFIMLCEPGLADPRSVARARERLSTCRGVLWAAGTMEEVRYNWVEECLRDWARWPNAANAKSFIVPSWHNRAVFPGGKYDPEIISLRANLPWEDFLVRICGVPVPTRNRVLADVWKPKRHVVAVEFHPYEMDEGVKRLRPVEVAVDPGWGRTGRRTGSRYVILAIQATDDMVNVVAEVAVDHMVHKAVLQLANSQPWWTNVTGGTLDPYAADSHPLASVSPRESWWEEARVHLRVPPRQRVETIISLLTEYLDDPVTHKPRLRVNPQCERLIWEMEHWRRKPNGLPQETNCDALKALGYYLVDHKAKSRSGRVDIPIIREYSFV